MKNAILKSMIIILSIAISSCEKQDLSSNDSTSHSITTMKQTSWGICCVWNGVDKCVSPAVNCFDVIVITPAREASFIELNEAAAGDADDVQEFFTDGPWADIFPDLDADEEPNINLPYLEDLQSGDYDLIRTLDGTIYYFLAGPEAELSIDNCEFVLAVDTREL